MDEDKKYLRQVQTSVTLFLYHNNDYLFIKRGPQKRVDPNKLNGIGGRLEPGEDYLTAALREAKEETGYDVQPENIKLSGVVKLIGGLQEDWVMCFFKIKVESREIPQGNINEDGELIWIDKDKVLDSDFELVDDLNYCFKDIISGEEIFFMTAKLGDDHKIYDMSLGKLKA